MHVGSDIGLQTQLPLCVKLTGRLNFVSKFLVRSPKKSNTSDHEELMDKMQMNREIKSCLIKILHVQIP